MLSGHKRYAATVVLAAASFLHPTGAPAQQTVFSAFQGTPPVIAVGLGTGVTVYRFEPAEDEYHELWTSAGTGRFFRENADTHWQMAFGDLDGDGREELVSVDQWSLNVFGDRGTTPVRAVLSSTPNTNGAVAIADPDGDGRLEILVGWAGQLSVWRYGSERLQKHAELTIGHTPLDMIWNINVADLDGDGEQDILMGGTLGVGHADALRIAHFDGTRLVHGDVILIEGAADVTRVYDWDEDGLPEIFTSGNGQRVQAFGWEPQALQYRRFWISEDLDGYVQGIAIGDLTGDGVPELVAGTYVYPDTHSSPPRLYFFTRRNWVPVLTDQIVCDQVGYPGLLIADLDGNGSNELLLNGTKIYRSARASDNTIVYGRTDEIVRVLERPDEVQPNAVVTGSFEPTGERDRSPTILVSDLNVVSGGRGHLLGIGERVELELEAENIGGEAREVIFRLVCNDPRVQVLEGLARFSFMNAEAEVDNRLKPFRVMIQPNAVPGKVLLRVEVSATGGYRAVRDFVEFELADLRGR